MPLSTKTCNEVLKDAEAHRRRVLALGLQYEDDPDASDEVRAKDRKAAVKRHEDRLLEADELVERARNREDCI